MAKPKVSSIPKLARHSFFDCTRTHNLFIVNENVAVKDGLEIASAVIEVVARMLGEHGAADTASAQMAFAASYLLEVTEAIIDSAVKGITQQEESLKNAPAVSAGENS